MQNGFRVLSVAVATGRIGCVFLVEGKLFDWRLSKKAANSVELAERQTSVWIKKFAPDVVVTEDVSDRSTKSRKTRELIECIGCVAVQKGLLEVKVPKDVRFKNKYKEAEVLGRLFPEIAAWVPKKPKYWETEPRNTVYFEALALALEVVNPPEAEGCMDEEEPELEA